MNYQNSPFVTDPRISGISGGNRKPKNVTVLTDRIKFNTNKISYINCNNNYLKVGYTNIRSVLNKFYILENYINLNNIDLFFWLKHGWLIRSTMPQCTLLIITFTEMIGLVEVLLSFSKTPLKLLQLKTILSLLATSILNSYA